MALGAGVGSDPWGALPTGGSRGRARPAEWLRVADRGDWHDRREPFDAKGVEH